MEYGPKVSKEDRELLEEAKRNLKLCLDAEDGQRKRELEDLAFQVGENQWDDAAKKARQGSTDVGDPPQRPMLSIPKLNQPMQQIDAQYRTAHLGVNVHPRNEHADKENAQVRQDLYRRIEQDSGADGVRWWAYDRAKKCGAGAYRIVAEWDDDTPDPLDQRIAIRRIYDQSMVLFDPACERADKMDGRFAFVLMWIPLEIFKDNWADASEDYEETFGEIELTEPHWVRTDGEKRAVLVAEYLRKVETDKRKYVTFVDGSTGYEDEAGGREVDAAGPSRVMSKTRVEIVRVTACEALERTWWGGKHIPLVPTLGNELQPWDKERRREGVIRPAKNAAQGYNYAVTNAIETVALQPKAPVVGYEGQFEGHEAKWDSVNTRNWSYLEVRPVTIDGKPAPFPQRMQMDTSGLLASVQLAQQFDQDIQASTGVQETAYGRDRKQRSGIAIERLQEQTEAGTSVYLYNMATYSLPCEATIILDALAYYYDRPGRIAQVLDAEDRSRPVMLNAPFTMGADGMPQRVDPMQQPMPEGVKEFNLRDGKGAYGVSVTIGKSYTSRLQQGSEQIGQVIQADPSLMMAFGDIWAGFLDVPGAPEIRDRLLKLIEQAHPGLTKKDGQETPEQLRAQLQGAAGKIQQLEQMLQQASQAMQTDQAKQRATMEKAALDNRTKERVALASDATDVRITQMEGQIKLLVEQMKLAEAARQREHERAMGRVDFARDRIAAAEGAEATERAEGREDERVERGADREDARSRDQGERDAAQADADRQAAMEQARLKRPTEGAE